MKAQMALLLSTITLIAGCATRSISDSGYPGHGYYGANQSNPLYKGEISEFDILGVDSGSNISDDDIKKAFVETPSRKFLRKGDPILLIQSGAMIPDQEITEQMEKSFSVSVFTGVPEKDKPDNQSYSKSLRLSAAKAGIGTIVVYWGVLESGIENLATKSVSWFPIIGSAVPDESQKMRIRLKVAVIDVRSGEWGIFTPKTIDDKSYSGRFNREHSDQAQVAQLKAATYELASDGVTARFIK
ncbi:aminopeptidase [Immundisolibacter sp.]|uniref:aminopeptidase n=1 Tax=Immundisolibacter sp. TaxID=1934948 RepID=UPI00356A410F